MDALSALRPALAGRYDVEREIGRGGMATVFLARDLRHDRRVALKVLDPELAAVIGAERFLGEIRVTAALQHPNLLPLFDSGAAEGILYYVMPYVEGESLRARLARERQLPLDDAVRIAIAIAGALDYAHRQHVVHRDLKPENVLLQAGEPVLADFGIALAVSNAGGARITGTGISLGTPQYMSPEQATGDRTVDGRSDVYSLGAMLYEMLAGEPPHTGPSVQAIIARLLTDRPEPVTALRPSVPEHVAHATMRALEKLPADRWPTARAFADALATPGAAFPSGFSTPGVARRAEPRPRPLWRALPWAIAAASLALAAWGWLRPAAPAEDYVLRIPALSGTNERLSNQMPGIPFDLSPDDRRIVYAAVEDSVNRLYTRALDDVRGVALLGTEGTRVNPAFSPDGRSIAFFRDRELLTMPATGGAIATVARFEVPGNGGLSWIHPDTIVTANDNAILAVPASGGVPRVVARPDTASGETTMVGPRVTPDASTVLYVSGGRAGVAARRVAAVSMRDGRRTISQHAGVTVLGVVHGHALWVQMGGTVMAAPLEDGRIGATAVPVLEGVWTGSGGAAKAALSRRGSLLYYRGEAAGRLVLVAPGGAESALPAPVRAYEHPRLSPDGRRVAVTVRGSRMLDIWVFDLATGGLTRLTTDGENDSAEWSPDGRRILYRARRAGETGLWVQPADGGPAERLPTPAGATEGVFSPDGRGIVFRIGLPTSGVTRDIGYQPLDGGPSEPLVETPFAEMGMRVSPDGRWLAYASDESGEQEVYVRPFRRPGGHVLVSNGGGLEPVWARDGTRLYYRSGRRIVELSLARGPELAVTGRRVAAEVGALGDPTHANFDAGPDGRLLVVRPDGIGGQAVLIHGWATELRARLGLRR